MSTPLGAQTVGDCVRVFSAGTVTFGRATAMTDEGFALVQGGMRRSFTYRGHGLLLGARVAF
ncbi:MAG: hypothetical protein F4Y24_14455 [Gemmatimonadetes bacterium]|nr:hypothetical protein [Gemmatimonadota bacterium]MYG21319.1 hypothetical protein [Gemmatimonadota bacterium]MYJ40149.1 hypothetical protein [Gemmatimonadota bacterium]